MLKCAKTCNNDTRDTYAYICLALHVNVQFQRSHMNTFLLNFLVQSFCKSIQGSSQEENEAVGAYVALLFK